MEWGGRQGGDGPAVGMVGWCSAYGWLDAELTLLGARHLVAVAEVRGRQEGFVFASVGEYLAGTGALIVTINAVFTSQGLRRSLLGSRAAVGLFRAVGRWSRGIGAREILLHATSGIAVERAVRTISRLGFVPVGQSYVANLTTPQRQLQR